MAAPPPLTRIHPAPVGPTTIDAAYRPIRPTVAGRPWVALCMVASIDGATAVAGRSGGLGNANDRAVLRAMRAAADVVLVGAGTAAGEGYGAPGRPGLRIGVVTNSGRVDPTGELFTSGAGFVVAPRTAAVPDGVDVLRAGVAAVDLGEALSRVDELVPGARMVSAEGGPQLNGALLEADLVDEVAVTTSPVMTGGSSGRITTGAAEQVRRFKLAQLLLDAEQFVFARWVRAGATAT